MIVKDKLWTKKGQCSNVPKDWGPTTKLLKYTSGELTVLVIDALCLPFWCIQQNEELLRVE
jgi:hypothetical protein